MKQMMNRGPGSPLMWKKRRGLSPLSELEGCMSLAPLLELQTRCRLRLLLERNMDREFDPLLEREKRRRQGPVPLQKGEVGFVPFWC